MYVIYHTHIYDTYNIHVSQYNIILGECRALKVRVSTEQLNNSMVMVVDCILRFKRLFHSDTGCVLVVSYAIVFTIECYTVVFYSVANKCSPKEFEKLSAVSLCMHIIM